MALTESEIQFIKDLGKRIVILRKKRNLKQKELSDILDMDDGSLRRIESGRTNPTTATLIKIAKALNVTVADLFDF